jgi:hypothetical protein
MEVAVKWVDLGEGRYGEDSMIRKSCAAALWSPSCACSVPSVVVRWRRRHVGRMRGKGADWCSSDLSGGAKAGESGSEVVDLPVELAQSPEQVRRSCPRSGSIMDA